VTNYKPDDIFSTSPTQRDRYSAMLDMIAERSDNVLDRLLQAYPDLTRADAIEMLKQAGH
jgi:hypothetical protein